MKKKDLILGLLVVIVWGANFTVIRLGLDGVPSMLLVFFRYLIVLFPAIFFVKKPKTEWKYMILYGLFVGALQFSCLFYAMEIGMPASLASIVVQSQAFIAPILAMIFLKEKLKLKQVIGILIAAVGLFTIGMASKTDGITSIPIFALLLTICAPIFWSFANIIARVASDKATEKGEKLDMLGLIVWSSLVPPIPVLGVALLIDTPQTLINAVLNLNTVSIFAILYLAFASTLFGYGVWNILLSKYPMGKISPLSLLVPITGLLTARIVLLEQLSKMQWVGATIILIGLIITNINPKLVLNYINNKVKDEKLIN